MATRSSSHNKKPRYLDFMSWNNCNHEAKEVIWKQRSITPMILFQSSPDRNLPDYEGMSICFWGFSFFFLIWSSIVGEKRHCPPLHLKLCCTADRCFIFMNILWPARAPLSLWSSFQKKLLELPPASDSFSLFVWVQQHGGVWTSSALTGWGGEAGPGARARLVCGICDCVVWHKTQKQTKHRNYNMKFRIMIIKIL